MIDTEQSNSTAAVLNATGASSYSERDIQALRDADHIRKRPDMYIGNTTLAGLHHLVYELVYNSIDEALAGYCKNIVVILHPDCSCTVADDGRGIPVEEHSEEKRSTLEVVMTVTGAGGKFNNTVYKVSAGLHGVGAKAVTALSEWSKAQVRRHGRTYEQEYEKGKAITPVRDIGAADHTGTHITFRPDPTIFRDTNFSFETLETRFRELAFLNRGISITLRDERDGREEKYLYHGGLAEFVEWLNQGDEPEHKVIHFVKTVETILPTKEVEKVQVEVALQYTRSEEDRTRCYANNAANPVGGTHLSGFRRALTQTIGNYGKKNNLFKDMEPQGEDYREGLTAIVSVQLPHPQFESQNKVRLNNPEVEGAVASVVGEFLAKYLEENPKEAQRIIKKVILAAEAREAAAKARKASRDRKNILSGGGLPGKLMDCTSKDRDSSELFLVEGDSAGGSAESGRDRLYQAVLPLRGKPLNVEKARFEHLLENEEIVSIMSAVGVDIGNDEEVTKIRYGKIIILTDADVDGQHIRTLLLTFFFRQMRKVIEAGHIFVARPPLYKVTQKKNVRFVQTAEEMIQELFERGLNGTRVRVQGNDTVIEGERLRSLLELLTEIERELQMLERRGLNLHGYLPLCGPIGLPSFRVLLDGHEHWFHTSEEVNVFRTTEEQKRGKPLVVGEELRLVPNNTHARAEAEPAPAPVGDEAIHHIFIQELHEIRRLNRNLAKLQEFGFSTADLLPLPRIAGREPPIRYFVENGDQRRPLNLLRDLIGDIRSIGERGLSITRFKGLGEMDPEELWATTLDPTKRTLLQVTLADAFEADRMFRVLMGEKVEDRRDFIYKHALDVNREDLDYGA